MHAGLFALTLVLALPMHSRSEGRAKLKLDDTGRLDAKITLSTLDMPELCDIDLSVSDARVREERIGILDTCIRRELPDLLRVHIDNGVACTVIVSTSGIVKSAVAIDVVASCPAFPDKKLTIDWGLFAGQPLDHVTVTTFEQPHAKPRLFTLSKRNSKLVIDVAQPLWPWLVGAGSGLAVALALISILAVFLVRKRRAAGAALPLVCMISLAAHASPPIATTSTPRFTIEDRVAVREKIRPDAEVCLVHMHGNEVNAREVMLELRDVGCANALWLDDARYPTSAVPWGDDRIPVPMPSNAQEQKCTVNPNRVLTSRAFGHRIANDCDGDAVARAELRRFLDEVFLPALARCRGRDKQLPVVTFHNNSNLTPRDMDTQRAAVVKGRESDILFVTRTEDFVRLSGLALFSVALQNMPPADDGSLSVLLQRDRYVNVEAQIDPKNKAFNRTMGEWALRSVGGWRCGDDDWPAEGVTSGK